METWYLEVCVRMVWDFGVEDGVFIASSWLFGREACTELLS